MWRHVRGVAVVASSAPAAVRFCTRRKKTAAVAAAETSTETTSPSSLLSSSWTSRPQLYGVKGYDFMEGFRALGPGAALGRLKATLSLYGVLGAAAVCGITCYLTTRSYDLTTKPDPRSDRRHQQFASDYAVLRNRWTGTQRVQALASDTNSALVTRRIRVNWLLYSMRLYLLPTDSTVVVDVAPELTPDRFARKRERRPSSAAAVAATKEEEAKEYGKGRNGTRAAVQLLFHSHLRPAVVPNGYQKGSLPQYERTLETVARDLLAERYRQVILSRAEPRLLPCVAEELLQNGQLSGSDVAWTEVVGDAAAFAAEVEQRVRERMGDGMILLHTTMAVI
ncbi:hypothetical protein DQ04_02681060 [Trypanosoma grayi]|uniref:hypothetical protein n=1 Tax=Trypanosoma grayi TaxID=71804 RepID=UPI0004F45491|nr:hypothetical protein DQ04_02681060 [Trypanosoma grayi]KEG11383.1 hypothetical protein DQ04_02681060 [Trypanosoma grayi]